MKRTAALLAAAAALLAPAGRAAPPAAGAAIPPPPAAAARPAAWRVERLRVGGVTDPARLAPLAGDHSLAAAADHLRRLGLRFTRDTVTLRAADLPGGLVAQLAGLPPGEPFVLAADGGLTVNAIVPGPADAAAWTPAMPGEPSPAQLAAARRFLDAAIPPAERAHFFDQLADGALATLVNRMLHAGPLGGMLRAHPALGPVFARFTAQQRDLALADLHAHLPQLVEAQQIGYARLFSADELDRLAAFFGQPVGRRFLQQSLLLSGQPEIAAWQAGVAARTQARLPAAVQALTAEARAALAKEHGNDVS